MVLVEDICICDSHSVWEALSYSKFSKLYREFSEPMCKHKTKKCNLTPQHMFLGFLLYRGADGLDEDGGVKLDCVNNNITLKRE